MVLQRNIGGWWIVKYNGGVWYTGTRDIVAAIQYALGHRKLEVIAL